MMSASALQELMEFGHQDCGSGSGDPEDIIVLLASGSSTCDAGQPCISSIYHDMGSLFC